MKVGFHLVLTHIIGINLQATVLQASFVFGMHLTWVLTNYEPASHVSHARHQ